MVELDWNIEEMELDEKFFRPVYFQAHLPMDYRIAKVVIPKRYMAHHLTNEYNSSMTTYMDYDFCRVRLNIHNYVEEILVVTKKVEPISSSRILSSGHQQLVTAFI